MSKFQLKVISENNESWPFMRGILTHSLVQHGMEFKKAYKVAQQVKAHLNGQETIRKEDLRKIIKQEARQLFGKFELEEVQKLPEIPLEHIKVISHGTSTPFSKGLLARTLMAAGIPPNHAHQMAQDVQHKLHNDKVKEITTRNLYKHIYRKILTESGEETAEFYKLATSINRMDRPVIIYIGGGIGTGKSSLATELASRLNILKVTGTDMIRQIMRTIFSEKMLPALHSSSFNVSHEEGLSGLLESSNAKAGFVQQAINVNVGVRAVVERAINENFNMIVEGVHLLPSLIHFEDLVHKAYHVPVMVSLSDPKNHKARFSIRQKGEAYRDAKRYEEHFKEIRQIHDHCVQIAQQYGVDVIDNLDFDRSINRLVSLVMVNVLKQIDTVKKDAPSHTH